MNKPSEGIAFEGGPENILYGGFKGMGDLLCATPVIVAELNAGSKGYARGDEINQLANAETWQGHTMVILRL